MSCEKEAYGALKYFFQQLSHLEKSIKITNFRLSRSTFSFLVNYTELMIFSVFQIIVRHGPLHREICAPWGRELDFEGEGSFKILYFLLCALSFTFVNALAATQKNNRFSEVWGQSSELWGKNFVHLERLRTQRRVCTFRIHFLSSVFLGSLPKSPWCSQPWARTRVFLGRTSWTWMPSRNSSQRMRRRW